MCSKGPALKCGHHWQSSWTAFCFLCLPVFSWHCFSWSPFRKHVHKSIFSSVHIDLNWSHFLMPRVLQTGGLCWDPLLISVSTSHPSPQLFILDLLSWPRQCESLPFAKPSLFYLNKLFSMEVVVCIAKLQKAAGDYCRKVCIERWHSIGFPYRLCRCCSGRFYSILFPGSWLMQHMSGMGSYRLGNKAFPLSQIWQHRDPPFMELLSVHPTCFW